MTPNGGETCAQVELQHSGKQGQPAKSQPQHSPDVPATCMNSGIPRRVSVRGCEGVAATVTVAVQQGYVLLSIVPPFTWESIMEPAKVGELIHVLALARDDAQRMMVASRRRVASGSAFGVQEISNESVVSRNRPIGPEKAWR